jgi:hypothetical protein
MTVAAVLSIASALTPDAVLAMPLGRVIDLIGGRVRLMERMKAAMPQSPGVPSGLETMPDGRKVMRITSFDQLASVLPKRA